MGTKQFSNYDDLLTFTRASGGHALRPVSYGDELVTNGTFDTDTTGWTVSGSGTGTWAVTNGILGSSGQTSFSNYLYQDITCVVGNIYYVSVDVVTDGTNNAAIKVGTTGSGGELGNVWQDGDGTGTFTFAFVATNSTHYVTFQEGSGGTASAYDNISVKEVTFDESDGTLILFEHPTNVPRVEWDSAGNRLGLLVEESRTNSWTESENFESASWTTLNSTLTGNQPAPNGTNNAYLITATDSSYYVYRGGIAASTNTQSMFMKAASSNLGGLYVSGGVNCKAVFNLSTGVVETVSNGTASITEVGNGWYRCSITYTSTSSGNSGFYIPADYGNAGDSVYIFGGQLELNSSFPTSYIKTTGSTATRSADIASIPVADFGYNQSSGSLLITATPYDASSLGWYASFGSAPSNSIQFYSSTSKIKTFIRKDGVDQATFTSIDSASDNTELSFAASFEKDNVQSTLNGGAIASDTSAEIPNITTSLKIGASTSSGSPLNGHIKSIKYYPRRLTNAQLQALTS